MNSFNNNTSTFHRINGRRSDYSITSEEPLISIGGQSNVSIGRVSRVNSINLPLNHRRRHCQADTEDNSTFQSMLRSWTNRIFNKRSTDKEPRLIRVGYHGTKKYPSNELRNRKYNVITFFPLVLRDQFRMFLNFYFLVMALSQFIPSVRVGYLYTYWGPLCFVLFITFCREGYDDIKRRRRDKEINQQKYRCWRNGHFDLVASENLKVGDLVWVEKDQRVPADMALLHCGEQNGSCFIRTDQLDGETDWKLRVACHLSQQRFQQHRKDTVLDNVEEHLDQPSLAVPNSSIQVEAPRQNFDSFEGLLSLGTDECDEPVSVENVLWASTVLATDQVAIGCVLYTGKDCRMAMNTDVPRAKVGLLDLEINQLTKVLFVFVLVLSLAMMGLKGFSGPWLRYFFRYVLLFSYIIPLSLRVTLDLSKMAYTYFISSDNKHCPGTVVRSSTIAEELGRISIMLCDKTGTLTQNEMIFKRLHLGTMSFGGGPESISEIKEMLSRYDMSASMAHHPLQSNVVLKRNMDSQVRDAIEAIALCHQVSPTVRDNYVDYQASSPDEVSLVRFCEQVGIALKSRDLNQIDLIDHGRKRRFKILHVFPFTSELKRMGIIVQEDLGDESQNNGISSAGQQAADVVMYIKGADTVIQSMLQFGGGDWLAEESGNLAREGLRILVYAKRVLSPGNLHFFNTEFEKAHHTVGGDRMIRTRRVVETILERDMQLLCITGVEDRLQVYTRETLESLKFAGIKVWMLTGDKSETAACIARSSRLFSREQGIHWFQERLPDDDSEMYVQEELNKLQRQCSLAITDSLPGCGADGPALVISGSSLHEVLDRNEAGFIEQATRCRSVVVCRCNPTQKAEVVSALRRQKPNWRIAAVGDGGNDVSMIQRAHAGIGIVGKEGKQASLAADFSIVQFSHLTPLLLIHGRNCYKRSAVIAQFVMHRGLLISIMQAVFSAIFYGASVSLYQGFLMVGYSTVYTMLPVFSLVLDCDVSPEVALTYPEIYKELQKGRSLNLKTFFLWLLISTYQGSSMMFLALVLFEQDFIHVVSITFTSLILTELLMVALTVRTWHFLMIVAELLSLLIYFLSLIVFKSYFDTEFLLSLEFVWRVLVITAVSCVPLYILKFLQLRFRPPIHTKLMQVSGSAGGVKRSIRSTARMDFN